MGSDVSHFSCCINYAGQSHETGVHQSQFLKRKVSRSGESNLRPSVLIPAEHLNHQAKPAHKGCYWKPFVLLDRFEFASPVELSTLKSFQHARGYIGGGFEWVVRVIKINGGYTCTVRALCMIERTYFEKTRLQLLGVK